MKVYVGISYNRDHNTEVAGVSASADGAQALVERLRKEPLARDKGGGLDNYPGFGIPPDMVGHVIECELEALIQ